jgi:S-adenosylmethionine:tRNA ribosyltransferase-isomerase
MLSLIIKTSDFDFDLPERLIAKYPVAKRDESRLLHYNLESKTIEHRKFKDISDILRSGDVLVRNITKVLPARIFLAGDKQVEILLLKPTSYTDLRTDQYCWEIIAKPARKLKHNHKYLFTNGVEIIIYRTDEGRLLADFGSETNFTKVVNELGSMPIPPYLKRNSEAIDKERYQTVYAQDDACGTSAAAPTAGLHFTEELLATLKAKSIEIMDLTLHVGLGTFLPVKTENILDHKMHSEYYSINENTWQKILEAKKQGRRIIAVGSTSVRCLESIAQKESLQSETNIFIYPGFKFQIVDGMVTNFHLPKSSLIMMISAFLGTEEVKRIYKEATEEEYRFFSYGDSCLFV